MTDDPGREIEIERPGAERSERSDEQASDDSVTDSADDHRLADELGRVDLKTTPEGYVEGRVLRVDSLDSRTIRLEVALPHGPAVEFDLEKPIPWSEEFLFARIVEDVGYDAASVGHLRGETVYVVRTDAGERDAGERDAGGTAEAFLSALPPAIRDPATRLFVPDRSPQWRLVDPLERPSPTPDPPERSPALSAGVVAAGAVLAVAGAVAAVASGFGIAAAMVAALPGLLGVLFGLRSLLRG